MKFSVYTLAAIVTAWAIALCFTGIFACTPVHKSWQPMTTQGHCIDTYAYYWGLQIPNIVTDFVILVLPFADIWKLALPMTQLLQVGGVLTLGLVTCVFDIIRLVVFIQMPKSMDVTWVNLAPAMWLDLETSVAILCACLPVMRPLLHPKRFWGVNHTRTRTAATATTADEHAEGEYTEMVNQGKGSSGSREVTRGSDGYGGFPTSGSGSDSGLEEGKAFAK